MSFSTRKSQRGFSLVELMVVVAIIGILASIAIPSVNKYMAKARQSEAKTNLSSLYTSEKAFFAEYNVYDSRFGVIGYVPEGNLRYNLGFTGGTQAGAANGYTITPAGTAGSIQATEYCANGATAMSATVNCKMLNGATNLAPTAIAAETCGGNGAVFTGCVTAATFFQAGARSRISSTAAADDQWAIDSNKTLRNTVDGIN